MSDPAKENGAPIRPGEPLDAVLSGARVPPLSDDFAARVLARTADRPAGRSGTLPRLRKAPARLARWRSGRRLAVGVGIFGTLAGAAAAASLFGVLPDRVPSPGEVWASIAGSQPAAGPAAKPSTAQPAPAPVVVEGPIDSPEELEEVFRRLDDARSRRGERRREAVDRRLDRALEQRREQGLPVPTPEQEAQLRQRIDEARSGREQRIGEEVETRREELRGAVEAGEVIEREDFLRRRDGAPSATPLRNRIERLRAMSPEERQERLRLVRERREQALDRETAAPGASPAPAPAAGSDEPSAVPANR